MITVEVLSRSLGIAETDISRWVELSWLRPAGPPESRVFEEVDVARLRLIAELRALQLDEEAMPVVLSLLDQLVATRWRLRLVMQAVEDAAPDAVRARLRDLMEAGEDEAGGPQPRLTA